MINIESVYFKIGVSDATSTVSKGEVHSLNHSNSISRKTEGYKISKNQVKECVKI